MSGAAVAIMNDAATGGGGGGGSGLIVTISAGQSFVGTTGSHTFSTNTCAVSGGTGPYTYAWTETDDGFGTWGITNATTATCTPHVAAVGPANSSNASLVCTVTDSSMPAKVQVSNVAAYYYFHYSNL